MARRAKSAVDPLQLILDGIVSRLVAMGLRHVDIAEALAMEVDELEAKHGDALAEGGRLANGAVANALFRAATDAKHPNVRACIYWLQSQAGWKLPTEAKPAPKGKKAEAVERAREAGKGTEWDGLLPAAKH